MQVILSDHNCEGQARDIFDVLKHDGTWLELVPMALRWFHQVGLSFTAPDEDVWQLCQENGYLLLTDNRTADDGEDSLELSILRLITPDILPVLTIGNVKRVNSDRAYRRACAEKLAEIVDELHLYRGVTPYFCAKRRGFNYFVQRERVSISKRERKRGKIEAKSKNV